MEIQGPKSSFSQFVLSIIASFLISAAPLYADEAGKNHSMYSIQQNNDKIVGVVTDVDGNFMPGVNVMIEGTNIGVATDMDGNFSIEARLGDILVFKFMGMRNLTYKIANTNV